MRVLAVRLDNHGDVLLTGPAVRAVAASGSEVTYLCRPSSAEAASLLPGVGRILTFEAPWIADPPVALRPAQLAGLIDEVARLEIDEAVIFTSFHQSALPTALVLRLAGVGRIAAISEDYPGTLLDVRHHVHGSCHEVERNLSLVEALGYRLPAQDDGRLAILPFTRGDLPHGAALGDLHGPYVVVHPGASVPARALPAVLAAEVVTALDTGGWRVVVTGSGDEWPQGHSLPPRVLNLAGRTDLKLLAHVLAGASALVAGNTGPVHLAAAVGTPVVSIFAPTVALESWHPWAVPSATLGDQAIACRHCRSRICPLPGQPCTAGVGAGDVLAAVDRLVTRPEAVA